MKTRAPPGREGSMERTKDFYNGMNYAKKQLQQPYYVIRGRTAYLHKWAYIWGAICMGMAGYWTM